MIIHEYRVLMQGEQLTYNTFFWNEGMSVD